MRLRYRFQQSLTVSERRVRAHLSYPLSLLGRLFNLEVLQLGITRLPDTGSGWARRVGAVGEGWGGVDSGWREQIGEITGLLPLLVQVGGCDGSPRCGGLHGLRFNIRNRGNARSGECGSGRWWFRRINRRAKSHGSLCANYAACVRPGAHPPKARGRGCWYWRGCCGCRGNTVLS